jgi:hypothetical protein
VKGAGGAGKINHPELPIRADQHIGHVAVCVVDETRNQGVPAPGIGLIRPEGAAPWGVLVGASPGSVSLLGHYQKVLYIRNE